MDFVGVSTATARIAAWKSDNITALWNLSMWSYWEMLQWLPVPHQSLSFHILKVYRKRTICLWLLHQLLLPEEGTPIYDNMDWWMLMGWASCKWSSWHFIIHFCLLSFHSEDIMDPMVGLNSHGLSLLSRNLQLELCIKRFTTMPYILIFPPTPVQVYNIKSVVWLKTRGFLYGTLMVHAKYVS